MAASRGIADLVIADAGDVKVSAIADPAIIDAGRHGRS
jgi:hypothetical protein